jgi:hypothetical protein
MRLDGLASLRHAVLAFGMAAPHQLGELEPCLAEASRERKGANCGVTVWRLRGDLGAEASSVESVVEVHFAPARHRWWSNPVWKIRQQISADCSVRRDALPHLVATFILCAPLAPLEPSLNSATLFHH